jgi:hypothetical protein
VFDSSLSTNISKYNNKNFDQWTNGVQLSNHTHTHTHTHNATIKEICEAFVDYTSTLCLGLTIRLNDFVDATFQQIGKIRNTHKLNIYIGLRLIHPKFILPWFLAHIFPWVQICLVYIQGYG